MPSCKLIIKQGGFTLIELLGVLSLTSMLLSIWVVPAYRQWLRETRLEIKAKELLLTLRFARTIAMQRHQKIIVCKSDNGKTCGGDWKNGWIVIPHTKHATNQVLQASKGLQAQQSLVFRGIRRTDLLEFQPLGVSQGYNGRFVLCAKGSKIAWFVFISATGRARLEASRDLSYCDLSNR